MQNGLKGTFKQRQLSFVFMPHCGVEERDSWKTLKSQCVLTIALLSPDNNSTVPFLGFANINLKPSRSPCTHQQFTKTSANFSQKVTQCLTTVSKESLFSTCRAVEHTRPFIVAHAICCGINTELADICRGSMQRFLPQRSTLIRLTCQQYQNMHERLHGSSHVHSSNRSKT